MTPADIARLRALGPQTCPPEVQEDCRLATVTTGTVAAQGALVWHRPRTGKAAVRVREGEPPVVGMLVRRAGE